VAELAVLDTSVIIASINIEDPFHRQCRQLFERAEFDLVVPMLCVSEVCHLVNRDLGPATEASFIDSLSDMDVDWPDDRDWPRIAELIRRYRDFPLGGVDASIVALAERWGATTVFTLDHRHFRAIRPRHVEAFTLLPEL
jgi:predicted nucleic acid-binding protein